MVEIKDNLGAHKFTVLLNGQFEQTEFLILLVIKFLLRCGLP